MAAVLGLIIGVVIGVFVKPDIPIIVQPYLPIMVVAALDALLGAARVTGFERSFSRPRVRDLLPRQRGDGNTARVPRQPARRRFTAADSRHRRTRHPHLLQRVRDQTLHLPRLTRVLTYGT